MSNAAEYLLQFFEVEQQPDGFRKDVLSAYTAMCSTERTLDTLIARGVKRLDMAKSQMPGIWKALWESFSEDANGYRMNFSTLAGATDRLDAAAVLALQTIADRWVELDVRMEDKDRENISGFLSEIEQCLKEDVSMPAALKSLPKSTRSSGSSGIHSRTSDLFIFLISDSPFDSLFGERRLLFRSTLI